MEYLRSVIEAYRARGYEVRTGLNPGHFAGNRFAPFTCLFKEGRSLATGGGLAFQEIFLLDQLSRIFSPRNVFVIGNAFGWSTLILSAIWTEAKVVAIDNCTGGSESSIGFDLTRVLIGDLGLRARVLRGTSPEDVESIVSEHLGSIDLALVDGLHTNEQQARDFHAVTPFLSEASVMLFHDVIDWGMEESFQEIASSWSGCSKILMRTPSGMGICYTDNLEESVGRVASLFTETRISGFVRYPIPSWSADLSRGKKSLFRRVSRWARSQVRKPGPSTSR